MVGVLTFPCIILVLICPTMSCLNQYWPTALSCGFLPNHLAFPVIAYSLLGSNVVIPDMIIIDSFIDFVSTYKNAIFREALLVSNSCKGTFTPQLAESLLNILSTMDCRELPMVGNIQ